jgi:hypothetical protein
MQPQNWIVGFGRTWWAQSSMAELESGIKWKIRREQARACGSLQQVLFNEWFSGREDGVDLRVPTLSAEKRGKNGAPSFSRPGWLELSVRNST